jgi:hypothetical protein
MAASWACNHGRFVHFVGVLGIPETQCDDDLLVLYWGRLSQFGEKRLLGTTKTPWVQCHGRTFFGGGVGLASRKGRTLHITSTLSVGRPPRCPSRRKNYRLNVCTPTTKMRKCLLATTNVLCLIFPWGYLHLRLLGPSFALITYPWRTTMLCQPELPAR